MDLGSGVSMVEIHPGGLAQLRAVIGRIFLPTSHPTHQRTILRHETACLTNSYDQGK
jgi:hypothetical protein